MRVFAIGDLHLSHFRPKPMDIFGAHWRDHEKKIKAHWHAIARPDDLLLLVGDHSWALKLDEFRPDLDYIASLTGRKLLIKGNHDLWWASATKVRQILPPGVEILQHESLVINGVAIVGSRGWDIPERGSFNEAEDRKIYEREVIRLKLAFETLRDKTYQHLITAIHYPPTSQAGRATAFTELIEAHGSNYCVYGHLHADSIATAFTGQRGPTKYQLVSADAVDFQPFPVLSL